MSTRIAFLAGMINVFISLFAWHPTASLAFKILGIICFSSAYILNKIEENKKLKKQSKSELSPEEQKKLFDLIKNNCDSKYQLRNSELSKKFQAITTEYSSRGFDIPPGEMFVRITDLYLKELYEYTDILLNIISGMLDRCKLKLQTDALVVFSRELILCKAEEFNSTYCHLIDHYSQFIPEPSITKTSFKAQIDHETNLNLSKMSSQIGLKNMA